MKAARSEIRQESRKNLYHCPEMDSPDVEFGAEAGVETHENSGGLHVELDGACDVVNLDIDHASRRLGLPLPELAALPLRSARVG